MNRTTGIRQFVVLLVGMIPILVHSPAAADISLPAVTDNDVASNSIDSTLFLEIPGQVVEYQAAVDISGEAWLGFDGDTRTLSIENLDLTVGSVDFSIPVLSWVITGTLELEIPQPYSVVIDPAYVEPVNGFFTTFMAFWELTYTVSAYIDGVPIVEDYVGYEWVEPFGIAGTFIEIGDNDGDGLNEYELAFHGPVSFSMDLGEIPPIGESTITIAGELDLGYTAEPLPPDSYEQDNFPHDGNPLSPDEVQNHSIHQDGDVDWITVSVLEDHEYEVESFNVSGSNPEMILEVYDDAGSMVATSYSGWYGALVSWTAAYTGTYYVKAKTWSWSSGVGHFDDQGGGWAYCDYDITLRITATAFVLLYPEDGSELSFPPIFGWTREGYDLFLLTIECYHEGVIHRNDSPPLLDTEFEMPSSWWDTIRTDEPCYWYVVGMDTVTGEADIAGPKVFWRTTLWGTPTSVMGSSKPTSDPLNYLFVLMAPIGAVLIGKAWRRKR
jgi:hypothetical protein